MTESEFLQRAEATLATIESRIERLAPDLDLQRTGPVLEIEFDDGRQMVINSHSAAQEIWVASPSGGFHFRPTDDDRWIGTRDGQELFSALSTWLSKMAGQPINLK